MLTDTATLVLAVTLATAPPTSAGVVDVDAGPVITRHDSARADGTPVWSSSASYELSTGDVADVRVEIDGAGVGEIEIAISGDTIVHTWSDGSGVETWTPDSPGYAPELIQEAMMMAATTVLPQSLPQAFPCSEFGEKVLRAGKYIWGMTVAATSAMCCAATGGGCVLCAAGAWAANETGQKALDNYCD